MNDIEIVALLLMIVAMFGLIRLYSHLFDTCRLLSIQLMGIKNMVTSLRYHLALDRKGMDERFDEADRQLGLHDAKMDYQQAAYADQIQKLVKAEGKRTRKESQETKTGDEWSKKREHEINEKLDELLKRLPDTPFGVPMTVRLPSLPGQDDTVVLKEGEAQIIAGTKVHFVKGDSSINGEIKNKRKSRRKKKPAASK